MALTGKVSAPSARLLYCAGEEQAANAPPSSLHWKVEPVSLDVKLKLGVVELEGFEGLAVMVVFGAVRSIVHVYVAGVESTFPAGSTARTRNVWLPSVSAVYVFGVKQLVYAAPSN